MSVVDFGLCVGFVVVFFFFFFFKQKTAYEIGTGDWSSDVCSSDLDHVEHIARAQHTACPNGQCPEYIAGALAGLVWPEPGDCIIKTANSVFDEFQ